MAKNEIPLEAIKFETIEDLKDYFEEIKPYYSYAEIGKAYGVNKGIVWKIMKKEYEPDTYEIRVAFGLPVRVLVQTVNGYIEPGSISLGSKSCDRCGQPFISNAGKRQQCFLCVKPRDRKAELQKRSEEEKSYWKCIECNKKIKGGFPHEDGHRCANCVIKSLEAENETH